jgi:hypothetical protein
VPTLRPTLTDTPRSPLPAGCGAVTGGTPVAPPDRVGASVIAQGTATLCTYPNELVEPKAMLDLDTGMTGVSDTADIAYLQSVGTDTFETVLAVNGSWLGRESEVSSGLTGCINSLKGAVRDGTWGTMKGAYYCLLTNEGHVAEVRVDGFEPLGGASMVLSFVTWNTIIPTRTPKK